MIVRSVLTKSRYALGLRVPTTVLVTADAVIE